MKKTIIEVCCASAGDVIEAHKAGADRVELNSNLFLGGITPSLGELIVAKQCMGMKIMTMVRPREGGFCYTDAEFKTALADAEMLLKYGADGIVFGFLHPDGTVDVGRCKEMMRIIGNRESVFHRAIDVVPDWRSALDTLCELGVTRVLTSGQSPSALDGMQTISEMIQYAHGRIQILPGAGINIRNARQFVAATGCGQIHVALNKPCYDTSASGNPSIFFGGALYPPEDRYRMIDGDLIANICSQLNESVK